MGTGTLRGYHVNYKKYKNRAKDTCSFLIGKKTEAQRNEVTCLSLLVIEPKCPSAD